MLEPRKPGPRPPQKPEDVALARKIFFGMMGTLVFLLVALAYGALRQG